MVHRNTHTQGLVMEELFKEPDDLQTICIQLHPSLSTDLP
jgi:hypothetical protein